jgi:predicted AAA+ superfamily ATPase
MTANYKEISKNLGKDQRTVGNYFEYLEFGLLLRFAFNYRGSPLASMRKMKKAYFTTPNLIFAFGQGADRALPVMLENLVMMETGATFFYKDGFEVDFVLQENGKLIAIEVKKAEKETKQLRKFSSKFKNVSKSFVVTLEEEGIADGIKIIPAWKFMLLRPYK